MYSGEKKQEAGGCGEQKSEVYLDEVKGDDDKMRKFYGIGEQGSVKILDVGKKPKMDSKEEKQAEVTGGGESKSELYLDEFKGDDDKMRKFYGYEQGAAKILDVKTKMDSGEEKQEEVAGGGENKSELCLGEIVDWSSFRDDDIMRQTYDIRDQEAVKIPYVGDKEPLSSLAAEYQSGSQIMSDKIKVLGEKYGYIRRTRGDGNCFFRGFMFGYLEYLLVSQDRNEVERVKENVEQCKKTLESLGYQEFTFEDFFSLFLEQIDSVLQGSESSISYTELVQRCRDQSVSDYVVMFFRFITSGEIKIRAEFFAPFIMGLSDSTVEQFCRASVEPMGEESDHIHITALSDALGVPIRVVYLDNSASDSGSISVNHHDFIPDALQNSPDGVAIVPKVTLLYRPGHYDMLYLK